MGESFNPDSLLFNTVFLRLILLIPIGFLIYILLEVYKQYKVKFKDVALIKDEIIKAEDHAEDNED